MNLSRYDSLFEDYLLNIALTKHQAENIDQMLGETLSLFLSEYEGDVDIYAQGSYAMGTTVRPLTARQGNGSAGEYDVDIVLERARWQGARETLESIRPILETQYGEKVDGKLRESCERVHHELDGATGVGFHVDYVPIKNLNGRYAAKRSADQWFSSDTKRLVEWFAEYADTYTFLPAVVLILKRVRDYAGLTDELPSICITALVCAYYKLSGSYVEDLLVVIRGVISAFSVPHDSFTIRIDPVNDDLASKISPESQEKVRNFFVRCEKDLSEAFATSRLDQARNYLSEAFPADINQYPDFLMPLRSRGWGIELDGSLNICDIREDHGRGSPLSLHLGVMDRHNG